MSFLPNYLFENDINKRNNENSMLRENRREKLLEEMKKQQEFQQQTDNIKFIINNIIDKVYQIMSDYISGNISKYESERKHCLDLLFTENPENLHEVEINYNPDEYDDENDLPCYETIYYFENPNIYENDLTKSITYNVKFNSTQFTDDGFLGSVFMNTLKNQSIEIDILCYKLWKILLNLDILLLSNELYDKELQNTIYLLGLLTIHCIKTHKEYNLIFNSISIILDLLKQSSEYDSTEKIKILIKSLI